jgi:hypothetical protein
MGNNRGIIDDAPRRIYMRKSERSSLFVYIAVPLTTKANIKHNVFDK